MRCHWNERGHGPRFPASEITSHGGPAPTAQLPEGPAQGSRPSGGGGETGPGAHRRLPVLDLALGLDLHPKPVGEPPSRLLGGKSPELYSGT